MNVAFYGGDRPPIDWSNAVVVIDGNSIGASSYHTGDQAGLIADFKTRAPLTSATIVTDVAIPGQTFAAMLANHSDADAAFQAGKTCLLAVWEVINSIWLGQSAAQAYADMLAYIAAVRAVHPTWKIVVVTGAYRWQARNDGTYGPGSQPSVGACNVAIDACNQLIRDGAAANGYKVADIRQSGSPFNFDSTVVGSYSGSGLYAPLDGSDANGLIYVHFSDAGFAYALQVLATACGQYRQ